jgi:two-component system phosphate regulon response regulator OmpR
MELAKHKLDQKSETLPHVLVVDDDDRLRKLLKRYLTEQGFLVSVAASAKEAAEAMKLFVFDVMVLDIMMPGKDGITFAQELKPDAMPILILSAKGEPEDRIVGLEAGVDDYLTKPFEPEELTLRLKSLLRRANNRKQMDAPMVLGDFVFNPTSNTLLTHSGELVDLTSTELGLLAVLANRRGVFVSREELAAKCKLSSERSVDIHITRLRKKIEQDASQPRFIQTARHKGYGLFSA